VCPFFSQLQKNDLAAFVITVLYLMGPVAVLVAVLPYYTRVKIALERITRFEKDIALNTDSSADSGLAALPEFETISFRNVVFEYAGERDEKGFKVGPINIEIKRGDLIFVTGGNGSGKSTFVKLLTGLYPPTSGGIWLNGNKIGAPSYASYRNEVAAIFTDNYLFSENYDGFDLSDENLNLSEFIRLMHMGHILRIENGKFDLNLSKGQMKRLALINGLLENKPVLVLDEWAAEQDPDFRRYFYREILPTLLQAGKTVIAVTHDDQYADCAQRLIHFDFGMITRDVRVLARKEVVH
jgi:ABC-type siderophore export system fused ATPase/permease subunit